MKKEKKKKCFIYSAWFPAAKLVNQVGFHLFPVTGIVHEQKPQSFYTDVMDGVSSLVEMVSDRLVSVVFYISQVFLGAGVEGASRFADVDFGSFGSIFCVCLRALVCLVCMWECVCVCVCVFVRVRVYVCVCTC